MDFSLARAKLSQRKRSIFFLNSREIIFGHSSRAAFATIFWKRALRYPSQTANRNTGIPACAPSGVALRCLGKNASASELHEAAGCKPAGRTGRGPVFRYG